MTLYNNNSNKITTLSLKERGNIFKTFKAASSLKTLINACESDKIFSASNERLIYHTKVCIYSLKEKKTFHPSTHAY